jgi:hypothetical protein
MDNNKKYIFLTLILALYLDSEIMQGFKYCKIKTKLLYNMLAKTRARKKRSALPKLKLFHSQIPTSSQIFLGMKRSRSPF